MSKAFTKDDAPDAPLLVPARAPLPEGVPNYVTARGLAMLRAELAELQAQRAAIEAEAGEDAERRSRLAALGQRIGDLERRIGNAIRVDSHGQPRDRVRFGASVTVRAAGGEERRYRIVGVDEADAAQGKVSFLAPIARAMLGRQLDEIISLSTARGTETLEIVGIDYEDSED